MAEKTVRTKRADEVSALYLAMKAEVQKRVVGKDDVIEGIFIALLAQGNVLLEGVPGIAKTFIANSMASSLSCDFKRVQFTADMLPSDIIGTLVLDRKENDFKVKKGPLFTNFLLADEINRSPPKTQSALLEAMQEKQVTIDVNTYHLDFPFIVVATQNPIEMEGTYPLPEAQLDRFLFKLEVGYPSESEEIGVLQSKMSGDVECKPVASSRELLAASEFVSRNIEVSPDVMKYAVRLVQKTRTHEMVQYGASPRASIALLRAGRVKAALSGRDYMIPDDVKALAYSVLNHRLMLKPDAALEDVSRKAVIEEIIKGVEVPK